MQIVRISTAGNIDDGKSTLIGRLLYETKNIPKDKIEEVQRNSEKKGFNGLDFSLFTDGLMAERAQNITIDVAHIYFATQNRKYILADAPGHFEYMRNMITAASSAEVMLIVCDVEKGTTAQMLRHLYIAFMLQMPNIVLCINKLDIFSYQEKVYLTFLSEIESYIKTLQKENQNDSSKVSFMPVSALYGENIAEKSQKMPWYQGETLLEKLENIPLKKEAESQNSRLMIQYQQDNYAFGRVLSGRFRVGQEVHIFPWEKTAHITHIYKEGKECLEAIENESIVIQTSAETEVNRGCLLLPTTKELYYTQKFEAKIIWLVENIGTLENTFFLRQYTFETKAKFTQIHAKVDMQTFSSNECDNILKMNDICFVSLETEQPVWRDNYLETPKSATFILIDAETYNTVALGFMQKKDNALS